MNIDIEAFKSRLDQMVDDLFKGQFAEEVESQAKTALETVKGLTKKEARILAAASRTLVPLKFEQLRAASAHDEKLLERLKESEGFILHGAIPLATSAAVQDGTKVAIQVAESAVDAFADVIGNRFAGLILA